MATDSQVNYTKREAIKEIFPDNPEYVWAKGKKPEGVEGRVTKWFNLLKKRFETFEHNKKSSIYNTYDHDYDEPAERCIEMPNGSVPSGNTNNMKDNLKLALDYRINNFTNDKKNGWNVFKKITGKYDVEAVDSNTLVERQNMLDRFLSLLKEDEGLMRYDPLTGKEAITEIVAEGHMKPIEYMFPLGLEDTNYVHYVVMEPEVLETIVDTTEDIDKIIEYEILNYMIESGDKIHPKRGIGVVMKKHGKALRPHIRYVQEKIAETIIEYGSYYPTNKPMTRLKKIFAKMDAPVTADIINEDQLVETFKKIKIAPLLKKIESKVLLKRLKRTSPPSDGKEGGASWPISAGGNYMLWVTTDPFEMLTKSTGRLWSERNASCENWDGCYAEGPVSDLKYGNCIVWVYNQGEEDYRQEIGRFLLRWGEGYRAGDKLDYDIGVEAQVYPKNPRDSPWGFNLLGAIGNILKDAGFLKYETCTTPYKFLGYSDKAGAGRCKINYDSKIFLKGQGEVEVGAANALVTMASDDNLSYADSGYVLNYGNPQALIALAQNPVIWIYENSIRRLFNKALDVEEGPQIVEFLFDSQVMDFNWIGGVLDTLEVFDTEYNNPFQSDNSLTVSLLRNGKCSDEIHEQILEMHPGYQIGNQIVPMWAVSYLNLLGYSGNPIVTSTPSHILDTMTDEIIKKHFFRDILRQESPVEGVSILQYLRMTKYPPYIQQAYDSSKKGSKNKYDKFSIQLMAINNIIFNPKLSLKSYAKLMTCFHTLWDKRMDDGGCFDLVLNHTMKLFALSLCLPMKNRDDWGYLGSFDDTDLGLDTIPECLRNITTIVDGEEIKYPIYHRQSVGTVRRMMALFPELVQKSEFANDEDSAGWKGLLLRNIRDGGAFKELSKDESVDTLSLLSRMTNPKDKNESVINPYITSRNYLKLFKGVENYSLFRYDYISQGISHMRKAVPSQVVDYILTKPDIMVQIGVQYVALWLTTPKQFNMFVNQINRMAFGKYFTKSGVIIPSEEEISESYTDEDSDLNLYILEEASFGGYGGEGGLLENPHLPDELQIMLLPTPPPEHMDALPKGWQDAIENQQENSWGYLSSQMMGDYNDYIHLGANQLSQNPGICSQAVEILLQSGIDDYKENIIKNSKISIGDKLVKEYLITDPTALLHNYNLNIRTYNSIFRDWLKGLQQNPQNEESRFETYIYGQNHGRRIARPGRNGTETTLSYLQKLITDKSWLRFWRGGTYKKALALPDAYNMAPIGKRDRPMALVDKPILIDYPHLIWKASANWVGEEKLKKPPAERVPGWKDVDDLYGLDFFDYGSENVKIGLTLSNIRAYQVREIDIQDGLIIIKGKYFTEEMNGWGEWNTTFNNVNDLYGFMEPDERPNPETKWRDDIVVVIADGERPPEIEEAPQWRKEITETEINKTLKTVFENPKNDSKRLIEICNELEPANYIHGYEGGWNYLMDEQRGLYNINSTNQWTPEIINHYLKALFNVDNGRYSNMENLLPTERLFSLSLSENREEVRTELGSSPQYLHAIQEWILSPKFETIIPIQYVYACITSPGIRARVKERAKVIRDKRLAEYLDFVRRDEEPEVNDAEEQHLYEWRIYNSEMSDILVNYCQSAHPHDARMQEVLMQNIVSGAENITAEDLVRVGSGV